MTSDEFPADLSQYITEHFNSVAQLEVLLLLRAHSDRPWTAAEVSEALRTTTEMAATQMNPLHVQGLLSKGGASAEHYQYAPRSEDLRQFTDRLATAYEERRVTVITLIYSKPVDKVQTFADAFRLRKES